ncbi:hypothetical protein MRX96_046782 [Rhipicephalus microplus]
MTTSVTYSSGERSEFKFHLFESHDGLLRCRYIHMVWTTHQRVDAAACTSVHHELTHTRGHRNTQALRLTPTCVRTHRTSRRVERIIPVGTAHVGKGLAAACRLGHSPFFEPVALADPSWASLIACDAAFVCA